MRYVAGPRDFAALKGTVHLGVLSVVLSVIVAGVLVGCGETSIARRGVSVADDVAAIRALQAGWNEAVENSDVAGYVAVLDDEIELLPTGAGPIVGTAGYAAMLEGVFSTDTFDIEVAREADIEIAGDWAFARYDYVISRMPIGSEEVFSTERKFLDIMRRQPDGSWRVYKHIWNYNSPDATP